MRKDIRKFISVGMVVKNYRVMCGLLNESEKQLGNSRYAQMKKWRCYFAFEKDGQKFIITEIYDIPRKKYDGRSAGNNRKKPVVSSDVLEGGGV